MLRQLTSMYDFFIMKSVDRSLYAVHIQRCYSMLLNVLMLFSSEWLEKLVYHTVMYEPKIFYSSILTHTYYCVIAVNVDFSLLNNSLVK